jgi:hypothetical protein
MKVLLLICLFINSNVYAAALNPAPKKGIVIFGASTYKANKKFDKKRKKANFVNNSTFEKLEATYFLQHGLNDKYALIAMGVLLSDLTSTGDAGKKNNTATGDQEVGIKYQYAKTTQLVKSWQLTTSFPTYSRSGDPLPGNHQHNIELRHLWDIMPQKFFDFHSIETGYRLRFDQPADLVRIDYTSGKNFQQNLILLHAFFAYSMKNHDGQNSNTNPNINSDYDNLKLGFSWVRTLKPQWRGQLGYLRDVWGRNIGIGDTLYLNAWYEY